MRSDQDVKLVCVCAALIHTVGFVPGTLICTRKIDGHCLYQVIDSGLVSLTDLFVRNSARAQDAQGTPTQSHTSPSVQVYEDELLGVVCGVVFVAAPGRSRPHEGIMLVRM